ncbi:MULTISPECIES: hypothetical protein [Bacillus]|uniref:hypothetical protein n=1 Tax=Bacillus TaxID=1386 RepID=UPI0007222315|nr:hypothetical protein [Bacillus altitudinis]MDH8710400.1 Ca2+/Na+ antiporter [Micromonospora sp. 1209]BAT48763.1 uncharacterized protein BTUAT1_16290 [Bacillus pumilus]APP17064.1 hypothetical protein BS467_15525 [Bacillus altitudinis]MBG9903281.1 hypothetical protein [Bacillus altitudinis]MBL7242563.1 hypothetical protein [Bacillus altitudinis]
MIVKKRECDDIKKSVNIGYFVLLLSFFVVYFLLPVDQLFTAIMILTLLFGVYQFVIFKKLKEQK